MAISPAGLPAWSNTADHTYYGGDTEKQDYLNQGPIDALTDIAASEWVRAAEDEAATVRVADFAMLQFTCNDGSPAAPTVNTVKMMTGVNLVGYAGGSPPSGYPTGARVGTGHVTFTFASSYTDAYGVSQALTIRGAQATVNTTTIGYDATASWSGQVVTVKVTDAAGIAVADQEVTLEIKP